MNELILRARELVKHNQVKKVVESFHSDIYDVSNHSVTIQKKPGRSVMTCTCLSGTQYCNEGVCSHKVAVILFESTKEFRKQWNILESFYKKVQGIKQKVDPAVILDDLYKLK